jgi:hypothetical protein
MIVVFTTHVPTLSLPFFLLNIGSYVIIIIWRDILKQVCERRPIICVEHGSNNFH